MKLFGRRETGRAASQPSEPTPGSPLALPEWLDRFTEARRGDYASGNAGRLVRASGWLRVVGEVIAFAGMIVMFMATLFWPANPAGLAALNGWIFVPGSLGQPPFTSPASYAVTQVVDMKPLTIDLVLLGLTVVGAGAIIRGRWLLAGLVGAFFLLPWSLLGFDLTLKPLVLPLYGILLVLRLYRPSTVKLMLLAPVLVIGAPIIISSLFNGIYDRLGRTPETADYRKIEFAALIANESRTAQETAPDRKPLVRGISLSGLSPLAPAAPYVMAQEYALRGEAPAAARALEEAIARGFLPNGFDKQRMSAIESYAADRGALGTLRQSVVRATYESGILLAQLAFAGGLVLAAMGPASSFLAGRMARRARRIGDAEERIRSALASERTHGLAARGNHDTGPQPSSAVFDSQTTMAAMSRRIRAYARASGWMAATAAICALGSWWCWLPPASSNTAFETIELVPEVLKLAQETGQSGIARGAVSDSVLLYIWFAALLCGAVSLLVVRSRRYRVGMVLAMALSSFVLPGAFFPTSGDVIALNAMKPDLRSRLVAFGETDPPSPPRNTSRAGGLSRTFALAGAGRESPQAQYSAAAYTLAQIAYLENRPADAAPLLNRMIDRSIIQERSTEQRTDLMIEWVVAQGQPAPEWLASPQRERPTASVRRLGTVLSILAAISAAAMFVPLGLLGYARHRRNRIEALVSERQGGQFDIDGTARQRLAHIGDHRPMLG